MSSNLVSPWLCVCAAALLHSQLAAAVASPHEDEDLDADSFQEQFLLETPPAGIGTRHGLIAIPDESDEEEVAMAPRSPSTQGSPTMPPILGNEKDDITRQLQKMHATGIDRERDYASSPEEEKGAADEKRTEHQKDIDRPTNVGDDKPPAEPDSQQTSPRRSSRSTSPPAVCRIVQPPPTLELVIGHKKIRTRDATASSESRVTLYGNQDVEISIRSEAHISVTRKDSGSKDASFAGPTDGETTTDTSTLQSPTSDGNKQRSGVKSNIDQYSPEHSSGIVILPLKKDRKKEESVIFSGEESIYRYNQGEAIVASIESPTTDESASQLVTDTGISLTRGTTDTMTSPALHPRRVREEPDLSMDIEGEEELTDAGLSPIQPDDIGLPMSDIKFFDEEVTLVSFTEMGTSPHDYQIESSSVALSPIEIPTSEASVYTDSVDTKDTGVSPIGSDDESLKHLSSISNSALNVQQEVDQITVGEIPEIEPILGENEESNVKTSASNREKPTERLVAKTYKTELTILVGASDPASRTKDISPPKQIGPKVKELQKVFTESIEMDDKPKVPPLQRIRDDDSDDDSLGSHPGVSKIVEYIEDSLGTPKHARRSSSKDSQTKEENISPTSGETDPSKMLPAQSSKSCSGITHEIVEQEPTGSEASTHMHDILKVESNKEIQGTKISVSRTETILKESNVTKTFDLQTISGRSEQSLFTDTFKESQREEERFSAENMERPLPNEEHNAKGLTEISEVFEIKTSQKETTLIEKTGISEKVFVEYESIARERSEILIQKEMKRDSKNANLTDTDLSEQSFPQPDEGTIDSIARLELERKTVKNLEESLQRKDETKEPLNSQSDEKNVLKTDVSSKDIAIPSTFSEQNVTIISPEVLSPNALIEDDSMSTESSGTQSVLEVKNDVNRDFSDHSIQEGEYLSESQVTDEMKRDASDPRPRSLPKERDHIVTERDVSDLMSEVAECTRQIKQEVRQLKPDLTPTPEGTDLGTLNLALARAAGMSLIPEVGSHISAEAEGSFEQTIETMSSEKQCTNLMEIKDFSTRPRSSADEHSVLSVLADTSVPSSSTLDVDTVSEPLTIDALRKTGELKEVFNEGDKLYELHVATEKSEDEKGDKIGKVTNELRSALIVGVAVGQSIALSAASDILNDTSLGLTHAQEKENSIQKHVMEEQEKRNDLVPRLEVSKDEISTEESNFKEPSNQNILVSSQDTDNDFEGRDTGSESTSTQKAEHGQKPAQASVESSKCKSESKLCLEQNDKQTQEVYPEILQGRVENITQPVSDNEDRNSNTISSETMVKNTEAGPSISGQADDYSKNVLKWYTEEKEKEKEAKTEKVQKEITKIQEIVLEDHQEKTDEQIIIEVEERLEKDIEMQSQEFHSATPETKHKIKVKVKDAKRAVGGFFDSLMGRSKDSDSEQESSEPHKTGVVKQNKKKAEKRKIVDEKTDAPKGTNTSENKEVDSSSFPLSVESSSGKNESLSDKNILKRTDEIKKQTTEVVEKIAESIVTERNDAVTKQEDITLVSSAEGDCAPSKTRVRSAKKSVGVFFGSFMNKSKEEPKHKMDTSAISVEVEPSQEDTSGTSRSKMSDLDVSTFTSNEIEFEAKKTEFEQILHEHTSALREVHDSLLSVESSDDKSNIQSAKSSETENEAKSVRIVDLDETVHTNKAKPKNVKKTVGGFLGSLLGKSKEVEELPGRKGKETGDIETLEAKVDENEDELKNKEMLVGTQSENVGIIVEEQPRGLPSCTLDYRTATEAFLNIERKLYDSGHLVQCQKSKEGRVASAREEQSENLVLISTEIGQKIDCHRETKNLDTLYVECKEFGNVEGKPESIQTDYSTQQDPVTEQDIHVPMPVLSPTDSSAKTITVLDINEIKSDSCAQPVKRKKTGKSAVSGFFGSLIGKGKDTGDRKVKEGGDYKGLHSEASQQESENQEATELSVEKVGENLDAVHDTQNLTAKDTSSASDLLIAREKSDVTRHPKEVMPFDLRDDAGASKTKIQKKSVGAFFGSLISKESISDTRVNENQNLEAEKKLTKEAGHSSVPDNLIDQTKDAKEQVIDGNEDVVQEIPESAFSPDEIQLGKVDNTQKIDDSLLNINLTVESCEKEIQLSEIMSSSSSDYKTGDAFTSETEIHPLPSRQDLIEDSKSMVKAAKTSVAGFFGSIVGKGKAIPEEKADTSNESNAIKINTNRDETALREVHIAKKCASNEDVALLSEKTDEFVHHVEDNLLVDNEAKSHVESTQLDLVLEAGLETANEMIDNLNDPGNKSVLDTKDNVVETEIRDVSHVTVPTPKNKSKVKTTKNVVGNFFGSIMGKPKDSGGDKSNLKETSDEAIEEEHTKQARESAAEEILVRKTLLEESETQLVINTLQEDATDSVNLAPIEGRLSHPNESLDKKSHAENDKETQIDDSSCSKADSDIKTSSKSSRKSVAKFFGSLVGKRKDSVDKTLPQDKNIETENKNSKTNISDSAVLQNSGSLTTKDLEPETEQIHRPEEERVTEMLLDESTENLGYLKKSDEDKHVLNEKDKEKMDTAAIGNVEGVLGRVCGNKTEPSETSAVFDASVKRDGKRDRNEGPEKLLAHLQAEIFELTDEDNLQNKQKPVNVEAEMDNKKQNQEIPLETETDSDLLLLKSKPSIDTKHLVADSILQVVSGTKTSDGESNLGVDFSSPLGGNNNANVDAINAEGNSMQFGTESLADQHIVTEKPDNEAIGKQKMTETHHKEFEIVQSTENTGKDSLDKIETVLESLDKDKSFSKRDVEDYGGLLDHKPAKTTVKNQDSEDVRDFELIEPDDDSRHALEAKMESDDEKPNSLSNDDSGTTISISHQEQETAHNVRSEAKVSNETIMAPNTKLKEESSNKDCCSNESKINSASEILNFFETDREKSENEKEITQKLSIEDTKIHQGKISKGVSEEMPGLDNNSFESNKLLLDGYAVEPKTITVSPETQQIMLVENDNQLKPETNDGIEKIEEGKGVHTETIRLETKTVNLESSENKMQDVSLKIGTRHKIEDVKVPEETNKTCFENKINSIEDISLPVGVDSVTNVNAPKELIDESTKLLAECVTSEYHGEFSSKEMCEDAINIENLESKDVFESLTETSNKEEPNNSSMAVLPEKSKAISQNEVKAQETYTIGDKTEQKAEDGMKETHSKTDHTREHDCNATFELEKCESLSGAQGKAGPSSLDLTRHLLQSEVGKTSSDNLSLESSGSKVKGTETKDFREAKSTDKNFGKTIQQPQSYEAVMRDLSTSSDGKELLGSEISITIEKPLTENTNTKELFTNIGSTNRDRIEDELIESKSESDSMEVDEMRKSFVKDSDSSCRDTALLKEVTSKPELSNSATEKKSTLAHNDKANVEVNVPNKEKVSSGGETSSENCGLAGNVYEDIKVDTQKLVLEVAPNLDVLIAEEKYATDKTERESQAGAFTDLNQSTDIKTDDEYFTKTDETRTASMAEEKPALDLQIPFSLHQFAFEPTKATQKDDISPSGLQGNLMKEAATSEMPNDQIERAQLEIFEVSPSNLSRESSKKLTSDTSEKKKHEEITFYAEKEGSEKPDQVNFEKLQQDSSEFEKSIIGQAQSSTNERANVLPPCMADRYTTSQDTQDLNIVEFANSMKGEQIDIKDLTKMMLTEQKNGEISRPCTTEQSATDNRELSPNKRGTEDKSMTADMDTTVSSTIPLLQVALEKRQVLPTETLQEIVFQRDDVFHALPDLGEEINNLCTESPIQDVPLDDDGEQSRLQDTEFVFNTTILPMENLPPTDQEILKSELESESTTSNKSRKASTINVSEEVNLTFKKEVGSAEETSAATATVSDEKTLESHTRDVSVRQQESLTQGIANSSGDTNNSENGSHKFVQACRDNLIECVRKEVTAEIAEKRLRVGLTQMQEENTERKEHIPSEMLYGKNEPISHVQHAEEIDRKQNDSPLEGNSTELLLTNVAGAHDTNLDRKETGVNTKRETPNMTHMTKTVSVQFQEEIKEAEKGKGEFVKTEKSESKGFSSSPHVLDKRNQIKCEKDVKFCDQHEETSKGELSLCVDQERAADDIQSASYAHLRETLEDDCLEPLCVQRIIKRSDDGDENDPVVDLSQFRVVDIDELYSHTKFAQSPPRLDSENSCGPKTNNQNLEVVDEFCVKRHHWNLTVSEQGDEISIQEPDLTLKEDCQTEDNLSGMTLSRTETNSPEIEDSDWHLDSGDRTRSSHAKLDIDKTVKQGKELQKEELSSSTKSDKKDSLKSRSNKGQEVVIEQFEKSINLLFVEPKESLPGAKENSQRDSFLQHQVCEDFGTDVKSDSVTPQILEKDIVSQSYVVSRTEVMDTPVSPESVGYSLRRDSEMQSVQRDETLRKELHIIDCSESDTPKYPETHTLYTVEAQSNITFDDETTSGETSVVVAIPMTEPIDIRSTCDIALETCTEAGPRRASSVHEKQYEKEREQSSSERSRIVDDDIVLVVKSTVEELSFDVTDASITTVSDDVGSSSFDISDNSVERDSLTSFEEGASEDVSAMKTKVEEAQQNQSGKSGSALKKTTAQVISSAPEVPDKPILKTERKSLMKETRSVPKQLVTKQGKFENVAADKLKKATTSKTNVQRSGVATSKSVEGKTVGHYSDLKESKKTPYVSPYRQNVKPCQEVHSGQVLRYMQSTKSRDAKLEKEKSHSTSVQEQPKSAVVDVNTSKGSGIQRAQKHKMTGSTRPSSFVTDTVRRVSESSTSSSKSSSNRGYQPVSSIKSTQMKSIAPMREAKYVSSSKITSVIGVRKTATSTDVKQKEREPHLSSTVTRPRSSVRPSNPSERKSKENTEKFTIEVCNTEPSQNAGVDYSRELLSSCSPRRASSAPIPNTSESMRHSHQRRLQTSLPSSPIRIARSGNEGLVTQLLTSEVFTRTVESTEAVEVVYHEPESHRLPTECDQSTIDTTDSSLSESTAIPSSSTASERHRSLSTSPKTSKVSAAGSSSDSSKTEEPEDKGTVILRTTKSLGVIEEEKENPLTTARSSLETMSEKNVLKETERHGTDVGPLKSETSDAMLCHGGPSEIGLAQDGSDLTDTDMFDASDNGEEDDRASPGLIIESVVEFENTLSESLKVESHGPANLQRHRLSETGSQNFLTVASGGQDDVLTETEEMEDIDENLEFEEIFEYTAEDLRIIDTILGEEGTVDISDNVKGSLSESASPAVTPEPAVCRKKNRKSFRSPKKSLKKRFLSPFFTTEEAHSPDSSEKEKQCQRSRRRRNKSSRNISPNISDGVTDVEDLELSASEEGQEQKSSTAPAFEFSSSSKVSIMQETVVSGFENKGPDTEAEDMALSEGEEAVPINTHLISQEKNNLLAIHEQTEAITDFEDLYFEQDETNALREMEGYYGSVAVMHGTKTWRHRAEAHPSSCTSSDDDVSNSRKSHVKRRVPKIILCKADDGDSSEKEESVELDWNSDVNFKNRDLTDQDSLTHSALNDCGSRKTSLLSTLDAPSAEMGSLTDTEIYEDEESIRPCTPEPFDEESDERIPPPVRELTLLKEIDEGRPESVVMPLGDAQPQGLLIAREEMGGITDLEDIYGDSGDEENECKSPEIPELEGGLVQSSDSLKLQKKRSKLLVVTDEYLDPTTDTEDIVFGSVKSGRKRRTKPKTLSKTSLDTNMLQAGISDVEIIEVSDFETPPQGITILKPGDVNLLSTSNQDEKTDVEDLSAPSGLEDDDQETTDGRVTPDCLKSYGVNFITSIECERPVSDEIRQEITSGKNQLFTDSLVGISVTPEGIVLTDVEEDHMTSADEEIIRSARVSIDAEQTVVVDESLRKLNLDAPEEAQYVKGALLIENHTDVEEIGLSEEEITGRMAVIDSHPKVCVCVTATEAGPLNKAVCVCVTRQEGFLNLVLKGSSSTTEGGTCLTRTYARSRVPHKKNVNTRFKYNGHHLVSQHQPRRLFLMLPRNLASCPTLGPIRYLAPRSALNTIPVNPLYNQ